MDFLNLSVSATHLSNSFLHIEDNNALENSSNRAKKDQTFRFLESWVIAQFAPSMKTRHSCIFALPYLCLFSDLISLYFSVFGVSSGALIRAEQRPQKEVQRRKKKASRRYSEKNLLSEDEKIGLLGNFSCYKFMTKSCIL